ncbi:hypothetical protein [Trinickia mobilis]|uniref:hypothetical protein n=1 Tax=Trinickia mobilis TaxID=2816356 RepID=UPI001A90079D|nr:hypothetical protein [Trinickia mobilis]
MHGTANFVIGILDDSAIVVLAQSDRQRKVQLTLACLVQLAALEVPAQEVQFGLCHRSLEAEKQAVVELAGSYDRSC